MMVPKFTFTLFFVKLRLKTKLRMFLLSYGNYWSFYPDTDHNKKTEYVPNFTMYQIASIAKIVLWWLILDVNRSIMLREVNRSIICDRQVDRQSQIYVECR